MDISFQWYLEQQIKFSDDFIQLFNELIKQEKKYIEINKNK